MAVFIEGTRRTWGATVTSVPGGVDLTTIASAVFEVRRKPIVGAETIETWTCTLDTTPPNAATATFLRVLNVPTASGVGSVDTAGDVLTFRALLTPTSGAVVECSSFQIAVVPRAAYVVG